MPKSYEPEFKKKMVRLHLEEGRSYKSLTDEYGVSKSCLSKWCQDFSEECQNQAFSDPSSPNEAELMKEVCRLRKELDEQKKRKSLFKKSSGIFCKGNRLEAYQFIEQNKELFGVRWLLRRLDIYPNAYYNYLKHRKADYYAQKETVLEEIRNIYHDHNGVDGYRSMRVYLERKNICLSALTVHKYMNKELGLQAIVRRKKPDYQKGKTHKVFDNLIKQNFRADHINQKWATDFTYLFLPGGETRYNCTVIDLYDRSVVASITDRSITSDLAIRTVRKAMDSQTGTLKGIILHSDQGSQYTSKAFTDFCEESGIRQSMSKAGYPYDNAPMERYFNTLKNELIYLHDYYDENALYEAIEEFAYVTYNHVRPHSYNGYLTPFEARHNIKIF